MEILKCENLSLGYDGNVLVSDLSFALAQGDYLCILGENGAGKSTLIRTLLGLQKPLGGRVTFSEGGRIGYLPQQTEIQRDFPASVEEVILSGCLNRTGLRPFYTREEKTLARSQLERLDISELRRRSYRTLSGGQQQRVLLARALCATGGLLLLDEPVSGLDPKVTEELYALIRSLNREDGVTVLMVTHDLDALQDATHVLHLGRTGVFFGTAADYETTARRTLWKGGSGE